MKVQKKGGYYAFPYFDPFGDPVPFGNFGLGFGFCADVPRWRHAGTYTPPKGGYSSGAAIGVGVGVAAGVGIAYLALRDRATLVGCVEESAGGMKLMNEKDKRTYTLAAGSSDIKPGERVALKGKKAKGKSGEPTFDVTKVAKDYGSCSKKTAENTAP